MDIFMVLPKLPDVVPQFNSTLLMVPSESVTSAETATASEEVGDDGEIEMLVIDGAELPVP